VQRSEFTFEVPPTVRKFGEFGEFCRIGIQDWSWRDYETARIEMPVLERA
jgi:hypothetical protein